MTRWRTFSCAARLVDLFLARQSGCWVRNWLQDGGPSWSVAPQVVGQAPPGGYGGGVRGPNVSSVVIGVGMIVPSAAAAAGAAGGKSDADLSGTTMPCRDIHPERYMAAAWGNSRDAGIASGCAQVAVGVGQDSTVLARNSCWSCSDGHGVRLGIGGDGSRFSRAVNSLLDFSAAPGRSRGGVHLGFGVTAPEGGLSRPALVVVGVMVEGCRAPWFPESGDACPMGSSCSRGTMASRLARARTESTGPCSGLPDDGAGGGGGKRWLITQAQGWIRRSGRPRGCPPPDRCGSGSDEQDLVCGYRSHRRVA